MFENSDLEHVLACVEQSEMPEGECDTNAFQAVFRRLVQEHVADRIFTRVEDANRFDEAAGEAVEIATEWFGGYEDGNWPFTRDWLRAYVTGRYHGQRNGSYFEDQAGPGRREFIAKNPTESARCNWCLGCDETEPLEVDHIVPASLHGKHSPDNFQYLCKIHNRRWKGDLLFWDGEIPVPDGG
jgi:hypothetical protein